MIHQNLIISNQDQLEHIYENNTSNQKHIVFFIQQNEDRLQFKINYKEQSKTFLSIEKNYLELKNMATHFLDNQAFMGDFKIAHEESIVETNEQLTEII